MVLRLKFAWIDHAYCLAPLLAPLLPAILSELGLSSNKAGYTSTYIILPNHVGLRSFICPALLAESF